VCTLEAEGFDVRRMNAGRWGGDGSPHDDLKATLGFPDYYGHNIHALADCLRDLEIADEGGMAVVLEDFDDFARPSPGAAKSLLDVFASGSRLLQLFGKTLVILVHTKDPDSDFGPLGAVTAWWNRKEFVRADRGKK
jgi:RNAse (barnase) inhibitor barstar